MNFKAWIINEIDLMEEVNPIFYIRIMSEVVCREDYIKSLYMTLETLEGMEVKK